MIRTRMSTTAETRLLHRTYSFVCELKMDLMIIVCFALCSYGSFLHAGDPQAVGRAIRIVQKTGASSDSCLLSRGATKFLETQGAEALRPILKGMKSQPLTVVNWLRCAFDDVSDRELAAGGKRIDRTALRAIAADTNESGYARRLAIELLDQLEPGSRRDLLMSWFGDPEFAPDAIDEAILRAEELNGIGDTAAAVSLLKGAFQTAIEPDQIRTVAARLKKFGEEANTASRLGTISSWRVIGPFPGRDMQAISEVFPPEIKLNFDTDYQGKTSRIVWKSVTQLDDGQWLDIKTLIGEADDAVVYAATTVVADREQDVELRAGADDYLQLWVNNSLVLGSVHREQLARTDQHRVKVPLKSGQNVILAKLCRAKVSLEPVRPSAEQWRFGLRVVDDTGRGIAFPASEPSALLHSER